MRLKEVVSRNNYITGCYFFKIKSSNLRKLLWYMKEVFKMSPLFIDNQNPNIRRMSDDSAISLLGSNGDFSSISNSSTISIFEETAAIRENKYLLKITKLLGKNITFIVALSGNSTAQMIN